MFRTLIIAIYVGLSVPAYIWLALQMAAGSWPEFWFNLDINHKTWNQPVLYFIGLVFVGGPITGLIYRVIFHFTKRSDTEEFRHNTIGRTSLKISWMLRLITVAACILIFGVAIWDIGKLDEPLGMWLFVSPLLGFFLYAMLYILLQKVSFDNYEITAMDMLFRPKTYPWPALTALTNHQSWGEMRLQFGDLGMVRVSYYLSDFSNLAFYAHDIIVQINEANRDAWE